MSGEPSHRPPPLPWGCLKGCRRESRSRLALGIMPGPCRAGRSGARSQSCPSARREAPLQSLQGEDLQPPGAGRSQRKSGASLPKDAACGTRGGLASGRPGSSRLKKALQGAAAGAGEGQGSEGAVGIRNTPLLPAQAQSRCWDPGPGEGSLLHCVIHELGLLRACLAAPPGGLMSPVKMAIIHGACLLCGPVYCSFQHPCDPLPGQSPVIPPYFTVAQGGHGVSGGRFEPYMPK